MTEVVLYDYPLSSASYRVRIALNLAGVPYRAVGVNLLDGSQRAPAHLARNPQGFVPALDIDGLRLTQSLAIVEYLDETRGLGLLPADPEQRAKVRALAYSLAVDVHPVCNVSVAAYATGGVDPERTEWMRHFIEPGLAAFEALLSGFDDADYACGPRPGLADICLMPQLFNADRWGADYAACTRINTVKSACAAHPAFAEAHPNAVA
ncbi:maleylacetoacetate isomerase [Flavimaricola marinus]|uniref:Maleylpyruvate isomerase n=1 Tax=Flavimaricola marinus TaxID=1819565 RepID=A0A238LIC7_9RHOB|nr:maleylacetoacetate isomerase [Flavimaricola marinus]SMY09401.1 Maleylpyruvate isomerase [Flavimaricola marinus]